MAVYARQNPKSEKGVPFVLNLVSYDLSENESGILNFESAALFLGINESNFILLPIGSRNAIKKIA